MVVGHNLNDTLTDIEQKAAGNPHPVRGRARMEAPAADVTLSA
jgi:hypothetical protein